MRNILLIPTCIITLINTSKLNKIVSQNERTEDGTALLLPSPSAVLGRGKGRGHINIYLYGSVPSSVHLIIKPKWDTISWSWRLQRPPVCFFGPKTEIHTNINVPIFLFDFYIHSLDFFKSLESLKVFIAIFIQRQIKNTSY